MLIKQKQHKFKDFSLSFNKNPLNNDIISLSGWLAVRRSVVNLILTSFHERPYQETLGTSLYKIIFESYNEFIRQRVESEIKNVLETYEPRIELLNIDTEFNDTTNELIINLHYLILTENLEDSTKIVYKIPSK